MTSLQSAVRPLICHACGRTRVRRNLLNAQPSFRTTAVTHRASSSSAAEVVVDSVTEEPVASSSRLPRERRGPTIAKDREPRQRSSRATVATSIRDEFSAAPLPIWKQKPPYRWKYQQLSARSSDPTEAVKTFADGRLGLQHYLHDGITVPLNVMLELLRLPATAGQLAELFPICLQYNHSGSRRQVLLEMVAACIGNQNFVLLPAAISAVLAGIDEGDGKRLLDNYRSLLNVVMIRPGVAKQADRVVLRLVSVLEADPTIEVPQDLVEELFAKTLTPATATRLLEFISNRGITIEEHFWRRAASLAFDTHQVAVANTFVAKAADQLAQDDASTKPHPLHQLMSAQVIPYGEALEILRPFLKITNMPENVDTPSTVLDDADATEAEPVQLGTPAEEDANDNADLPSITELSPERRWGSNDVFDINDTDSLTQRAWTLLFTCAGADHGLKYYDVIAMIKVMPEEALHVETYTAAMRALLLKNAHGPARDLWGELCQLHMAAHPSVRWKLIDARALVSGAEAMYRQRRRHQGGREPLQDVIRLVDKYAARGGILSLAVKRRECGPPKVVGTNVRGSVVLNTLVVNKLLDMCVRSRTPSMAFRIWAAARPRWNVLPDDNSLALLLKAAGRAPEHGNSHRHEHEGEDVFRYRMRTLAKTFHLPVSRMSLTPPLEQPDEYWLKEPSYAFNDPSDYRWSMEHERGPWEEARNLFKTILLSNYPDLALVTSPISYQRDIISEFRAFVAPPSLAAEPGTPAPMGGKYAYLLPGPASFHSYVALQAEHFAGPYAGIDGDVGQPLAWMRALRIKPYRKTMLEALMTVANFEGPRRRVRIGQETQLVRDEEILRAYLVEWLGDGVNEYGMSIVPTEEDVAAYHRRKQMKRLELKMRRDRQTEEWLAMRKDRPREDRPREERGFWEKEY